MLISEYVVAANIIPFDFTNDLLHMMLCEVTLELTWN